MEPDKEWISDDNDSVMSGDSEEHLDNNGHEFDDDYFLLDSETDESYMFIDSPDTDGNHLNHDWVDYFLLDSETDESYSEPDNNDTCSVSSSPLGTDESYIDSPDPYGDGPPPNVVLYENLNNSY